MCSNFCPYFYFSIKLFLFLILLLFRTFLGETPSSLILFPCVMGEFGAVGELVVSRFDVLSPSLSALFVCL